jgi:hypothetical protein
LLVSIGLAFLSLGVFDFTPTNLIQNLEIGVYVLSGRLLSLIFGATMFLAGIVFLIVEKEKYGVHIVTAEGEKEVIVSRKREYVAMIDEALTKALEKWKF